MSLFRDTPQQAVSVSRATFTMLSTFYDRENRVNGHFNSINRGGEGKEKRRNNNNNQRPRMESNTDYINEQQGKCRVTRRIENLLVQIKLQIYNETRLNFLMNNLYLDYLNKKNINFYRVSNRVYHQFFTPY